MSENFGLVYESTFTGSMVGTSPTVFAVWMYVLAHGYGGQVDLNPVLLAATFGTTRQDVEAAIRLHCSPDPDSRSTVEEGRRLLHLGGVAYEIVNHDVYKNARSLAEKRSYNRAKKRESRERRSTTDVPIFDLSKNSLTTTDPLVLVSVSSSSGSDPEGVQGEPPPPALVTTWEGWDVPAELYAEAEREHGIERDELDHRVRGLRNRPLPGKGVRCLTEHVRLLLPEWESWAPPKPKGVRRQREREQARSRRPPWATDAHFAFANARGALLTSALAKEFALKHRPHEMTVPDAQAALMRWLEERLGPAPPAPISASA